MAALVCVIAAFVSLAAASSGPSCGLNGRWTGFIKDKGLHDSYGLALSGNTLSVISSVFFHVFGSGDGLTLAGHVLQ
jgi:hypothetical protein